MIDSSDNTSFVNASAFGRIYIFDKEAGTMRLLSVGRIFKDEGWIKRMSLVKQRFEEVRDELEEWGFDISAMEELFTKHRMTDWWNWFILSEFQRYYDYLNTDEGRKKICGSVTKTRTLDEWLK